MNKLELCIENKEVTDSQAKAVGKNAIIKNHGLFEI